MCKEIVRNVKIRNAAWKPDESNYRALNMLAAPSIGQVLETLGSFLDGSFLYFLNQFDIKRN